MHNFNLFNQVDVNVQIISAVVIQNKTSTFKYCFKSKQQIEKLFLGPDRSLLLGIDDLGHSRFFSFIEEQVDPRRDLKSLTVDNAFGHCEGLNLLDLLLGVVLVLGRPRNHDHLLGLRDIISSGLITILIGASVCVLVLVGLPSQGDGLLEALQELADRPALSVCLDVDGHGVDHQVGLLGQVGQVVWEPRDKD